MVDNESQPGTKARSAMSPPLAGVTVLDFGQLYCAPYCGFLLARMGADVIKIESPAGDLLRHRAEPSVETTPHILINSNKRGIRLDLKQPAGLRICEQLVSKADVVIENFATGVMDRLGLGYDRLREVNPRLIYGSAKGFGSSGPYADLAAMDLTVQAMAGVMAVNGFADAPPVKAGVPVADFSGGTHLAIAVVSALFQREITGLGQQIEVSMHDALLPLLASSIGGYLAGESYVERPGNHHGSMSVVPYNSYETSDGYVTILCAADRHWRALCGVMAREDLRDDESLSTMRQRASRADEIDDAVESWTRQRTKSEVFTAMRAVGIPAAPVKTIGEVLQDDHLIQRGMIQQQDHPTMGKTLAFGSPMRFSGSEPVAPRPAPLLGQHSEEILYEKLNLGSDEVAELKLLGII